MIPGLLFYCHLLFFQYNMKSIVVSVPVFVVKTVFFGIVVFKLFRQIVSYNMIKK